MNTVTDDSITNVAAALPRSVGLVGPMPPPGGGMANQTHQLKALLEREGIEVDVVRSNADYRPRWTGRIPVLRAFVRLAPYLHRLWKVAGRVALFHVMANSGWSWYLFAVPAIWIATLRNVPVVVNYRGGLAESFLAGSWNRVRPSLSRCAALVVPSGYLQAIFSRFGARADIVPNIVDPEVFKRRDAGAQRVALETGAPRLVVTRNLEPIYDNATVIRAFAVVHRAFPAARLSIAGAGPEREMLGRLAGELSLEDAVTFTGPLAREEVADLYSESDIFVNGSLVDNMPNSILEALASGLPVVTTRAGGIPSLVRDDETALLVDAGDDGAMARALLRLLEQPGTAFRLRDNGLALVDSFTWPAVREKLFTIYARAIRGDGLRVVGERS